jgi:peroxiredoxin
MIKPVLHGYARSMYPTPDKLIEPGKQAPDFDLMAAPTQNVRLSALRERPVVLVFYPGDFSPVCTDQLSLYQTAAPAFANYHAQVLAISTDGVWCHQAFAQQRELKYPLLADAWPHGATAEAYGVLDTDDGTAARALFVLDPSGVVTWNYLSPAGMNPGADGILAALDSMTSKAVQS